jgi:hypothetical protein
MGRFEARELERRIRRAYELSRLRRAGLASLPLVALVAFAAVFGERRVLVVAIGAVLTAVGLLFHWRGEQAGRALVPGIAAGLVPLAAAHCALAVGPSMMGADCASMCVAACTVGGIASGAVIGYFTHRSARLSGIWAYAGILSLLTGALGCVHVGYSGLVGMAGGLLASGILLARFRAPAS